MTWPGLAGWAVRFVRTEVVKFWLTVALAAALASATVAVNHNPSDELPVTGAGNGALLFQAKGCSTCHTIKGVAESGSIGPNLTGLARVAGERMSGMTATEYVVQSVREPSAFTVSGFSPGVMPVLELSDAQVQSLVTFLLTKR